MYWLSDKTKQQESRLMRLTGYCWRLLNLSQAEKEGKTIEEMRFLTLRLICMSSYEGEKKRRILQNCSRGDWLCTPVVFLYFQSPEPHPAGRSGGRSPERCRWSGREPHLRRSTVCSTRTDIFAGPSAGRDAGDICASECGNRECNRSYKWRWGGVGGGATLLL